MLEGVLPCIVRARAIGVPGKSSEVIRSHQESSIVIRSHQESSGVIRSHQESSGVIRSHKESSRVIRSHQESSRAICVRLHRPKHAPKELGGGRQVFVRRGCEGRRGCEPTLLQRPRHGRLTGLCSVI